MKGPVHNFWASGSNLLLARRTSSNINVFQPLIYLPSQKVRMSDHLTVCAWKKCASSLPASMRRPLRTGSSPRSPSWHQHTSVQLMRVVALSLACRMMWSSHFMTIHEVFRQSLHTCSISKMLLQCPEFANWLPCSLGSLTEMPKFE